VNPPERRRSPEEIRESGATLVEWLQALSEQCNVTASRSRLGDRLPIDDRLRSAADGIDAAIHRLRELGQA
jgi:hypothetical protein